MLLQGDAFYGRQVRRDVGQATALLAQAARSGRPGAGFMLHMLESSQGLEWRRIECGRAGKSARRAVERQAGGLSRMGSSRLHRTDLDPALEETAMFRFFRSPLQGIHAAGWAALPMRLAGRAARTLADRRRRAMAYRDLQSLDAQLLRDIGLSHRAAAECPRDVRE
jgi:uncharacterized protein YjiS (DUF1127 family)